MPAHTFVGRKKELQRLEHFLEQAAAPSPAMRHRAADLGARIRAENGIAQALAYMEPYLVEGKEDRLRLKIAITRSAVHKTLSGLSKSVPDANLPGCTVLLFPITSIDVQKVKARMNEKGRPAKIAPLLCQSRP